MLRALIASVGILALCGCMSNEEYFAALQASGPTAVAGMTADGEELICFNRPVTGSNRPRRECFTRTEREEMQRAGQDFIERQRETGQATPASPRG